MNKHPDSTIEVKKNVPFTSILFILCGMAAAWVAIGSTGLLAHPLRKAITILLLLSSFLVMPSKEHFGKKRFFYSITGFLLALILISSAEQLLNLMGVMVFYASFLIFANKDSYWQYLVNILVKAIFILIIYRLLLFSVPLVWFAAQSSARIMGSIAGFVSGSSLWPGPTFAGIDFLILSLAFLVIWWTRQKSSPSRHLLYFILILMAGHLFYLMMLTILFSWLYWQLPLLAALLHLIFWLLVLRFTSASVVKGSTPILHRLVAIPLLLVLTMALALASSYYAKPKGLQTKKIVAWKKGFLNWEKAKHGEYGRLSQGMYGMLPQHIKSLGAEFVISADLSAADLDKARVLILIYPADPWPQGMLQRIWNFVKKGGSLLVLGEHTVQEKDGGCRFNEVLAPTAMRVRFDSATFAVGGWLHSYQQMNHPAFMSVSDQRNEFGIVIGASVEARWPARPLVLGRWGWNDPGDTTTEAMMGNNRYDAGEKLGDLVLAAEQQFGKGRIVVLGDTSGFTNGIMTSTYPFVYRLLSYLAHAQNPFQPLWRQILILFLALFALLLIIRYIPQEWLSAPVILLALCLTFCYQQVSNTDQLHPEGRLATPNNLAYFDTTHMEKMSQESWRPDGCMGLMLALVRDNYLPLMLNDFNARRLEQAGVLISIAPTRAFSKKEREIIRDFIDGGGVFIITVGYKDHLPVKPLLQDFGFSMSGTVEGTFEPIEPEPLGHFKSPFIMVDDVAQYVRFHAAWPIFCSDPQAQVIAYGGSDVPVILLRRFGKGKMVVVADSGFAHNINLELEDGSAIEGLRENAIFWRWFITVLQDEPHWIPKPPEAQAEQQQQTSGDQSGQQEVK